MKRILLSAAVLSVSVGLRAQVGIDETDPKAMLDVAGDLRVQSVPEVKTVKEDYSKCPCLLLIGEDGKLKRYGDAETLKALGIKPGSSSSEGSGSGSESQGSNEGTVGSTSGATLKSGSAYVVALDYQGAVVNGTVPTSGVEVKIPYTGGSGSYTGLTLTSTSVGSAAVNGQPMEFTLEVQPGSYSSSNPYMTAFIKPKSAYEAKKITEPGHETDIVTFKLKAAGQQNPVDIKLKAVGGIPDKKFSDADHKFIYTPVTVKIGSYNKVWLNQNLGAEYAKVDGGHFNPKKVGGDNKSDYKAYGSLFQFGRDADGHELMVWSKTNTSTYSSSYSHRAKPGVTWNTTSSSLSYSEKNDPCPNGYRTPSKKDWQDFHQAITGSRTSVSNNKIWTDTKLNLAAAGDLSGGGSSFIDTPGNDGLYWSSSPYDYYDAYLLYFHDGSSDPEYTTNFRSYGRSVRCLKKD